MDQAKSIWISRIFNGYEKINSVHQILEEKIISKKDVEIGIEKFVIENFRNTRGEWNDYTKSENGNMGERIKGFRQRSELARERLQFELSCENDGPARKKIRGRNRLIEVGTEAGVARELWVRPGALTEYFRGFDRRVDRVTKKIKKIKSTKKGFIWQIFRPGHYKRVSEANRVPLSPEAKALADQMKSEVRFAGEVRNFMEGVDKSDRSLTNLLHLFKKGADHGTVCQRKFRRALGLLGFRYNTSQRVFRTTPKQREATFMALDNIFLNLINQPNSVNFFDATTFCFEAHPRRSWQSWNSRTYFPSSTNYKRYHLLMILGRNGVRAWQICVGKMTTAVVAQFILLACTNFRTSQPQETPWVLLDNAKMHKTELIKRLSSSGVVSLTFTGPHSPFINPIEEAFRYIKAPLKNRHFFDQFAHKRCPGHGLSQQD